MSTTVATLQPAYQHPSALYPVVEDITELEYSTCCPCDHETNILGRFPLRDIGFTLSPAEKEVAQLDDRKHHRRRSSSSSSSLLKRRHSRESSFDDETTVNTENEETVSKFEDVFVLTRQVFACAQSQVWECVQRTTGLRRCVKIVDFDTLTQAEKEACHREIALLQKLQGNEGIIKLHEVYMNRKAFIVMDLATGGNLLSRVIQQEMLPEENVRRIALTILQTLKHLQAFDLCHNGVEPSNLVFNGVDDVKIIDFGRTCTTGEALGYGALHTSYTSPEILNVNACTAVSDVWSLGAVLYFCFYGQAPIPYSKRRSELTFPYNEYVSRQAKQFMIACLHHDPTVRLTVEEALAHPWLEQETEPKLKFSWKQWWRKWFCKREPSNDILSPSTTGSSGIVLSPLSFSWKN